MRVDMTPTVFLALCGLVKDAMLEESDASAVLQKAAAELAAAFDALSEIPEGLEQHSATISRLADETPAATVSSQAVA